MTPTDVRVAIAVVEQDGRFLVGRRSKGTDLAGHAEFPGGKIQHGESASQAARRECLEETGLSVVIVRQLETVSYRYDYGELELEFFLCRTELDDCTPHAPFRWVDRSELASLNFPDANSSVVQYLTTSANRLP